MQKVPYGTSTGYWQRVSIGDPVGGHARDPGGLRTRARLYGFDKDNDRTEYRIDAVEQAVPSLPTVPVALQPEVIREYRVPTPIHRRTPRLADPLAGHRCGQSGGGCVVHTHSAGRMGRPDGERGVRVAP